MIRRNRRYRGIVDRDLTIYPPSQTSQLEPNLRDILVAYSRGEDVSDYIRMPAVKATAEQQFTNRIARVDPLTELQDYVNNEIVKANKAVEQDKLSTQTVSEQQPPSENSVS